jgi:glycine/D-amino acid oxidase-like deaminating enzyme
VTVTGVLRTSGGRVRGVRTGQGDIPAGAVVNAAGVWGGEVARLAGVDLPILPRRGFILVTEPLHGPFSRATTPSPAPRRLGTGKPDGPGQGSAAARQGGAGRDKGLGRREGLVRHKVYTAAYVTDVASDSAGLETSAVVESTPAGTVLIGASRERAGFDRTVSLPVLGALARQAVALFPALAGVRAIRAYCGFRPYCPDHLPVIGPDPRVPGLLHACGHEGAGIGLAAATGHLIAQSLTADRPDLDLAPFSPDRFRQVAAG